jgi:plastocyanin
MIRILPVMAATAGVLALGTAVPAAAAEPALTVTLQDHKFSPSPLEVPADTKVSLTIKNLDPTPAEFESDDFHAEKVVKGKSEITTMIGPFKPGEYEFHDEYHEDASKTKLIAR